MTVVVRHEPGIHDLGPAVVALGVFDGVHVGHQALVREAMRIAGEREVTACVLTFDRDPDQVVTPGRAAPQLTTLEDKIAFLVEIGPGAIVVVPFDEGLARMEPESFVEDVLADVCSPVACVVGADFRFGAQATGDADTLRSEGRTHGFDVRTFDLVNADGSPVSSSRIRALIAAGEVEEAASLLGRPHRLHGVVVRGMSRGRTIGVPTANIDAPKGFALPASGVYAGWVLAGEERYPAAISVGLPPTFPDASCVLEAHLIGFAGDLYDHEVTVEFAVFIRAQRAFDEIAELGHAITDDVARATTILGERDR